MIFLQWRGEKEKKKKKTTTKKETKPNPQPLETPISRHPVLPPRSVIQQEKPKEIKGEIQNPPLPVNPRPRLGRLRGRKRCEPKAARGVKGPGCSPPALPPPPAPSAPRKVTR